MANNQGRQRLISANHAAKKQSTKCYGKYQVQQDTKLTSFVLPAGSSHIFRMKTNP